MYHKKIQMGARQGANRGEGLKNKSGSFQVDNGPEEGDKKGNNRSFLEI